jgi:Ca2+-binding EF-hand superfamily protein
MKSLAAAALLLITAPGLAQAPSPAPKNCAELLARLPSDSLWMRAETKQDAETRTTAIHKSLDLNHDGYVTLDEINQIAKRATGATAALDPHAEAFVRRVLLEGDSDHDGRLSLAENLAGTDTAFVAMDTNHDGKVTADERCAAMDKRVQQMVQEMKQTAPDASH